ncbi:hypothetical protein BD410DRAFT_746466 [Rickenella mellea]|uniref:G-patch domain-containing protein n=1 Tax=Rickenella mellea TaxID=50990 RepID=A0A4Y7Q8D4_9AGAM|nr:hypothetical protein BD410DRAFT_746466 [Rickenella mellea]
MTARLKKKLGEMGIDPSSSKANESFCLIGTPLPPLEKSKDTGEFVPLWKQDVRDEKGRRRLHGAFTGGFSAGYFNTVGSKEGWTPQTFVSSRSDRAKQKAARPEDFMDEEDLAELKDSQKLVDTTEEMDLIGGTQSEMRKRGEPERDSIVSALEDSLLPAPKDSVGARILKKMGWRIGNGIGPKVTWEQRKRQDALSSSAPSADDEVPESHDEEAAKHMYPPRDSKVPSFSRKDNPHGLGYVPGMGLTDLVAGKSKDGGNTTGPNLSAGFGLGALNDAEEDDLDVYDSGFNKSSTRLAFDDADEEERIVMGSRNKQSPTKKIQKPGVQPSFQTFQDGRAVLPGFVLSDRPVVEDKWYPLPEVPKGWSPDPRRVWEKDKENIVTSGQPPAVPPITSDHASWKRGITADQRGSILGETPLPAAPKSVFDYLAPKDRERLQSMASGQPLETPVLPPAPTLSMARVEPQIAKAALNGFQPFTADPVKQTRYTAYLQSQVDMEDVPIKPTVGQSMDEFHKELSDYAKAAQIFKPVSGTMAGRFTSAAIVEQVGNAQEGLHKPKPAVKQQLDEQPAKEEKQESAKEHAARLGMFGPLTREIKPWQPAKLLCKRFGVKDPNPELLLAEASTSQSTPTAAAIAWKPEDALANADLATAAGSSKAGGGVAPSSRTGGRRDLSNVGLGDDETQGADTLTYERPAKDIFKAIFASDDEESDDEAEKQDKKMSASPAPVSKEPEKPVAFPPQSVTAAHSIPSTSYGPQNGERSAVGVDLSSFKPTFVPRADREKRPKSDGKERSGKKEKKRKSGKTALVSFDVEEDGGEAVQPKKKKQKQHHGEDDDGLWVEKPPPEIVKKLDPNVHLPTEQVMETDVDEKLAGPQRGRKRAVDFM